MFLKKVTNSIQFHCYVSIKKNSGKPLTNAQCLQNLNKISRNNMGNLASCNRLICIKLPSKPTSEINERIRMNDMLKKDHAAFGSRRTRVQEWRHQIIFTTKYIAFSSVPNIPKHKHSIAGTISATFIYKNYHPRQPSLYSNLMLPNARSELSLKKMHLQLS